MVVPFVSEIHSTWSPSHSRRPSHHSIGTKPVFLTKPVYKKDTKRRTLANSWNVKQHFVDLVDTFEGWELLVPQKLQFDAFDRDHHCACCPLRRTFWSGSANKTFSNHASWEHTCVKVKQAFIAVECFWQILHLTIHDSYNDEKDTHSLKPNMQEI